MEGTFESTLVEMAGRHRGTIVSSNLHSRAVYIVCKIMLCIINEIQFENNFDGCQL